MMVTFGVRMTYGLWLAPASSDLGWGIETLSFAMAIQALAWGIATPFAGAVADRWGTRPGGRVRRYYLRAGPSGDGQCDDPLRGDLRHRGADGYRHGLRDGTDHPGRGQPGGTRRKEARHLYRDRQCRRIFGADRVGAHHPVDVGRHRLGHHAGGPVRDRRAVDPAGLRSGHRTARSGTGRRAAIDARCLGPGLHSSRLPAAERGLLRLRVPDPVHSDALSGDAHRVRCLPQHGCVVDRSDRPVQRHRLPYLGDARRAPAQEIPAGLVVHRALGGLDRVRSAAGDRLERGDLRLGDGHPVARHRAADRRAGRPDLRHPLHGHAVRLLLRLSSARRLHRHLGRRLAVRGDRQLHGDLVDLRDAGHPCRGHQPPGRRSPGRTRRRCTGRLRRMGGPLRRLSPRCRRPRSCRAPGHDRIILSGVHHRFLPDDATEIDRP